MSSIVTQAGLLEIIPELRAMVAAEPAEKVRDALNRLVDRYTAMSEGSRPAAPHGSISLSAPADYGR